jgi:hypothetical protein
MFSIVSSAFAMNKIIQDSTDLRSLRGSRPESAMVDQAYDGIMAFHGRHPILVSCQFTILRSIETTARLTPMTWALADGYLYSGQADHLLGRILKTVKGVQGKPTLSNLYQSA